MKTTVRVLLVEDDEQDAFLFENELQRTGFAFELVRVEKEPDFREQLQSFHPDIIITDFRLPVFDGLSAILIAKEIKPEIPLIVFTGSVDEITAVRCIKAGADNYVLKDNINALVPAMKAALKSSELQREKEMAEELLRRQNLELQETNALLRAAEGKLLDSERELTLQLEKLKEANLELQESRNRFYQLFTHMSSAVAIYEPVGDGENFRFTDLNNALERIEKVRLDEVKGRLITEVFPGIEQYGLLQVLRRVWRTGKPEFFPLAFYRDERVSGWKENYVTRLASGEVVVIYDDVTERKMSEEVAAIRDSAMDTSMDGMAVQDKEGKYIFVNQAFVDIFGRGHPDECINERWEVNFDKKEVQRLKKTVIPELYVRGKWHGESCGKKSSGEEFPVELSLTLIKGGGVFMVVRDISEIILTNRSLRESEQKYRQLIDNTLVGVNINRDGKIVFCNQRFAEIFGYSSSSEVVGLNISGIILEEDLPIVVGSIRNREEGASENVFYQCRGLRKDGAVIWLEVMGSQVEFEGKPAMQGSVLDISDRRAAEEGLRKLSRAVEQSPVSIVITNPGGDIQYVNPKFTEVSGYSFDEVHGKNPRILKSGLKKAEEYKELWDTITSGKTWTGEFPNLKKNGELFWEFASISPIIDGDGKIINYVGVKDDITQKKKIEAELIAAKEKAEESDRLKSSLLANMSHEFRTPLNGILGFADLLASQTMNAEVSDYGSMILTSGRRLLNTLENILTLAQLEGAALQIKPRETDLVTMVDQIAERFHEKVLVKGLTFNVDIATRGMHATTDPDLLEDAVSRILDNALKFTDTGGITLRLVMEIIEGKPFGLIKVIDSGIGIAAHDHRRVFEPFRQASEGLGRHYEGSGLGLNIANRIVALIGGTIDFDSMPGKGSAFTIRIPVSIMESTVSGGIETPGRKEILPPLVNVIASLGRKPSVLVVEDNDANAWLIRKTLSPFMNIDLAADGDSAVVMTRSASYDLILMDINLGPGIDGITATDRIRERPAYAEVPVAALTGYTLGEERDRIMASSLTHYLGKPFTREALVDLVHRMLYEIVARGSGKE